MCCVIVPVPKREQEREGDGEKQGLLSRSGRQESWKDVLLPIAVLYRCSPMREEAGERGKWSELYHGWQVEGQSSSWMELIALACVCCSLGLLRRRGQGKWGLPHKP